MLEKFKDKFTKAVMAFQNRRFADAERALRDVLRRYPRHFDTLHLLGIIACETGQPERGVEFFRRAIGVNAKVADAHFNLANALLVALDRPGEAISSYNHATALKPDLVEAYNNCGIALKKSRRPAEALENYDKALALMPDYAEAYNNRGNALLVLKRTAEALACFDKAISLKPTYVDAHNNRCDALVVLKRFSDALESCEKAIALKPDYPEAYSNRGNALKSLGRLAESLSSYDKAIALNAVLTEAWLGRGNVLIELKKYVEAFAAYDSALALKPGFAEACLGRGNVFTELKRYDEAFAAYGKALTINPDLEGAWLGRGHVFFERKLYDEAFAAYDKALAISPDLEGAWLGRGNAFTGLKRYDEAFAAYDKTLAIKPDLEGAWLGRGNVFTDLKRYDEALAAYDKALALNPDSEGAWLGRGNVFAELKRYDEAVAAYDKALARNPDLLGAWLGRGNAFGELKRYDEALAAYDKALALKPDLEAAWLGRGNVFGDLKHYDEAFAAYDKALALKPDLEGAWLGRGNAFTDLKRYDEAFVAYDKALALNPDLSGIEGSRLHSKMHLCNWGNFESDCNHLIGSVRNNKQNVGPFAFLGISSSVEDQYNCARLWVSKQCPPANRPLWKGETYKHDRIRIGYLSADFHEHATSYLMAGVFENHDKSRFNITAISIGPNDYSQMRRRLEASFEKFVDARALGDLEVATLIRDAEIDILVDLKGFTQGARTNIFAHRPAPVQVNYLGYPGTMGASYIDYILADAVVVPLSQQSWYAEKVVHLPDSYQANDTKRIVSERIFTREECGLPDGDLVFCCFNNNYKIAPAMFDCWMRILSKVPGSVLWLLEDNASTAANLKREAELRGVNAGRLVFAERLSLPDHLARHRLADLVLDTLPYNAHTTASDALWAGLPVLTQIGETFAGRVAGSLLNAIGLPELITRTPEEYERMAVDLAMHGEKLAVIKRKLAENRLTKPLFDTKRFTRHLETAYIAMYMGYQAAMAPNHIVVPS